MLFYDDSSWCSPSVAVYPENLLTVQSLVQFKLRQAVKISTHIEE